VIAEGLDVGRYVELVGVTTLTAGLDAFARAFGIAPFPIPPPRPGEPSRHRPESAKPEGAWVPMIAPEGAVGPEADLYGGGFVPGARLIAFTDAVLGSDDERLARERDALRAVVTPEAFVDTCALIGAFNVVDRVADATGIPLDAMLYEGSQDVRDELGLAR